MSSQGRAVRVKNGAGLRYRDNAVSVLCLRCANSCPDQYGLFSLVYGVAIDEAAIIVLRHEANFLAFGFARHAHTALRRHSSYLRLGILAQGEAGVRQLLLVEHVQHIRLILSGIKAPAQPELARERVVIHAHVMARRQVIGIERQGAIEQQGEADMAIAGQAGIGGTPCHVLLVKEIHHVLFKLLLNIHQVERYIEHPRHAPGIIHRFEGAAFILSNIPNPNAL